MHKCFFTIGWEDGALQGNGDFIYCPASFATQDELQLHLHLRHGLSCVDLAEIYGYAARCVILSEEV